MKYIIYDLEATCWEGRPPNKTQETIEIGAVKVNGYGESLGTFNRFVRPVVHPSLSVFCRHLTSIDQTDVERAAEFPAVIEDFMDWIDVYDDEAYVLCGWGNFDRIQLQRDAALHRLDDDWLAPYINVKQQYARMRGLTKPRGLARVVKDEGFTFTGLHHRAISDAENLAKVFVKHLDVWQY